MVPIFMKLKIHFKTTFWFEVITSVKCCWKWICLVYSLYVKWRVLTSIKETYILLLLQRREVCSYIDLCYLRLFKNLYVTLNIVWDTKMRLDDVYIVKQETYLPLKVSHTLGNKFSQQHMLIRKQYKLFMVLASR